MSVIGEQIKKYRIEKGITQEQLGQMIGVTTQGVSRWERGGTPDAEILPRLSEILGVSIDTLFGREEQSLTMSLARRLSQMEEEEAYHYAFNICWAIELGLMGNNSVFEDFVNKFLDPTVLNEDKKLDYFAKNIHENGMANLRMSPDLNHFFLLLQPKGNLKDQLCDRESLRKVFAAFADDKLLRIILYVYSFPYMPIATSLISKNVGLSLQETDHCMQKLCEVNLVTCNVVATAEGNINSYNIRRESFAIPLLCFADEMAKKDWHPFLGEFNREKPFL